MRKSLTQHWPEYLMEAAGLRVPSIASWCKKPSQRRRELWHSYRTGRHHTKISIAMVSPECTATRCDRLENASLIMRTHDARGQHVTIIDPVMLHAFRRRRLIEARTLERMVDELEPGTGKIVGYSMFIVVPFMVVLIGGLVYFVASGPPSARRDLYGVLTNPGILGGTILGCWLSIYLSRRKRCPLIPDVMLRYRHCPHCGYDLRAQSADPSVGAAICPECGCHWRMPPANAELTTDTAAPRQIARVVLIGLLTAALLGAFLLALMLLR